MKTSKICGDGKSRCSWVTEDQIYLDYHDLEWGQPTKGQLPLFEAISLEGFQAGLSWLTILKRRSAFRTAFAGFDPALVSKFSESDVENLMLDASIIRNRAKILSVIHNAKVIVENGLDLTEVIWSLAPAGTSATSPNEWLTKSDESIALSRELKRLGLSFVGPTTMYALMQSSGMIYDHAPGCLLSK